VDLQLVERERAQIEQARIARTEIVERNAHAEGFELAHGGPGVLYIAEQGGFRELELEAGSIESGLAENPLHDLDEIRPAELQRRYIHRERQAGPGGCFAAGFAQNPFAERDDQLAVLGDRDE